MTQAEIGGLGVLMIFVLIGVLLATRLSVESAVLRRGLYAICCIAITMLVVGVGSLRFVVEVNLPPVLPVAMLAVAISASAAIMLLAMRYGWLNNWAGRAGAGLLIYMILIIAYPPPVGPAWQLVAVASGVALAGVGLFVWWLAERADNLANGPRVGAPMMAEIMYDVEGDDDAEDADDWVVQPVHGWNDGGVRVEERNGNSEGAGQGGYSEIRLSGSGSEGIGRSGRGAGAVTNGDSQGTGEDRTRNGVAPGVAHPRPYRGGRGRRLSGAVLPRQGAHHPSASAGEYDAAAATIATSIA